MFTSLVQKLFKCKVRSTLYLARYFNGYLRISTSKVNKWISLQHLPKPTDRHRISLLINRRIFSASVLGLSHAKMAPGKRSNSSPFNFPCARKANIGICFFPFPPIVSIAVRARPATKRCHIGARLRAQHTHAPAGLLVG